MKKRTPEELEDMRLSIEDLSQELLAREYECAIFQETVDRARGKYWQLLIKIDRVPLDEKTKEEVTTETQSVYESIEEADAKLLSMKKRIEQYRARIEKVQARYLELTKQ